jgi:hypothetical protein
MPKSKKGRKWSTTYKKSIDCNRPKGFSQKQYCKYGKTQKKLKRFLINNLGKRARRSETK